MRARLATHHPRFGTVSAEVLLSIGAILGDYDAGKGGSWVASAQLRRRIESMIDLAVADGRLVDQNEQFQLVETADEF